MKIIGIAGLARSGKDTIAKHLARYGYFAIAFADPLRGILRDQLGVQDQYMDVAKEIPMQPHGASYRTLMQTFGDAGRNIHGDFWIQLLERQLGEFADEHTSVVITDVRYSNEAQWVRQYGHLWHVRRSNQLTLNEETHSSEWGVEPLTGEPILNNFGDIKHLLEQVDSLMHD